MAKQIHVEELIEQMIELDRLPDGENKEQLDLELSTTIRDKLNSLSEDQRQLVPLYLLSSSELSSESKNTVMEFGAPKSGQLFQSIKSEVQRFRSCVSDIRTGVYLDLFIYFIDEYESATQ